MESGNRRAARAAQRTARFVTRLTFAAFSIFRHMEVRMGDVSETQLRSGMMLNAVQERAARLAAVLQLLNRHGYRSEVRAALRRLRACQRQLNGRRR